MRLGNPEDSRRLGVHGVAPDVVDRPVLADQARHHLPRMDSYPRLKHFAEPFACIEHSIDHAERHIGNGMRVTGYFFRYPRDRRSS